MVGIDTLAIFLPIGRMTREANAALVSLAREERIKRTGEICYRGAVGNLRFSLDGRGLYVVGSLAAYAHGQNVEPLRRSEIPQALERLSDELHADASAASVCRVDVAATMIMQHKPGAYLPILGYLPHFTRLAMGETTLEYRRGKQRKQELAFYDKTEECRARGGESLMPSAYRLAGNALRYEARLMKQVPAQIGVSCLQAGMPSDRNVFARLCGFFLESFKAIRKTYAMESVQAVKTPKEGEDYIKALLLSQAGSGFVEEYVQRLGEVMPGKNDKSRLRALLEAPGKKFSNRGDWNGGSLARELDLAVINETLYTA